MPFSRIDTKHPQPFSVKHKTYHAGVYGMELGFCAPTSETEQMKSLTAALRPLVAAWSAS